MAGEQSIMNFPKGPSAFSEKFKIGTKVWLHNRTLPSFITEISADRKTIKCYYSAFDRWERKHVSKYSNK